MTSRALMLACCCAILVQGCAAGRQPVNDEVPATEIEIEGITIRNELAYPVTDVMINVPATGAFAGCGNILPHSACSNTFQQVDYRANAIVVSWKEYGAPHQTGEFVLETPTDLQPGAPATAEVVIFAPGQAGARLIQP